MKLTPMEARPATTTYDPGAGKIEESKRDAAVKAFLGNQPQETPVKDATRIQPEEMTAIQSQVPQQQQENRQSQVIEAQQPEQTEPPVSSQLALLARKEKQFRARIQQQDREYKAKEAALAQQKAELEAKYAQNQFDPTQYVPKSRLKEQTLEVLAEEGLSYDELTQQLINQQPRNPRYDGHIARLEAQVKALTDTLDKQSKNQQTQQDEAYKAAVRQIETDVNRHIKSMNDFPLIQATKSNKDVVELIERTFKEEGYIMSVEDATQEVEDYLTDEASKLARIDKVQKRLAPPATPPTETKQQPVQKQQPMKTLTNANSAAPQLSRRERAILAAQGLLKP